MQNLRCLQKEHVLIVIVVGGTTGYTLDVLIPPLPRLKLGGGGYLNFIDNKKCVLFILKINFFHKPKVSLLTLKA